MAPVEASPSSSVVYSLSASVLGASPACSAGTALVNAKIPLDFIVGTKGLAPNELVLASKEKPSFAAGFPLAGNLLEQASVKGGHGTAQGASMSRSPACLHKSHRAVLEVVLQSWPRSPGAPASRVAATLTASLGEGGHGLLKVRSVPALRDAHTCPQVALRRKAPRLFCVVASQPRGYPSLELRAGEQLAFDAPRLRRARQGLLNALVSNHWGARSDSCPASPRNLT